MMIFVVPQLYRRFRETNQELPFLTKVLIGSSHFIKIGFLFYYLFLRLLAYFVALFKNSGRQRNERYSYFEIPIIGNLLREVYLSRFSENLSTLIKGGLPIITVFAGYGRCRWQYCL